MKNSFLLFLLIGITLLSCTQKSDDNLVTTNFSGDRLNLTSDQFLTSSNLDGIVGGELTLNKNYINSAGRVVSIEAHLNILPNSFAGTKDIIMIVDAEDASIRFFPETIFNRVVKLDLKFTGLDLNALGFTASRNADFVFINDNGTTEDIENENSTVNLSQNIISVTNARLYHFSRYSWVR